MPKKLPSYHQLVTPKRAEVSRPHSRARGYTRMWQRLRAMQLARFPWCADCGGPADQVDHIVPLSRGGTNRFSNLQSLCASCHSRKTYTEDGAFGRVRPSDHCKVELGNRRPPQHFSRKGIDDGS